MKLEFIYSQIIAKYITNRKDFYNFILTNHKNKNAALSLKINNFPLIQGDELRFPNIETQIIYDNYDIPMVYLNRKIKYIKDYYYYHNNQIILIYDKPSDEIKLNINKSNRINNYKYNHYNCSKCNNIWLIISKMPDIIINDSFKNLTKLFISISDNNTNKINIELPSLKLLKILESESNNVDITINAMKLNILIVPKFKSLTVNQHNLLCIDTNFNSIDKIKCDFNYPFVYNGIICHNFNEFKQCENINEFERYKNNYDYNKMLELIDKYYHGHQTNVFAYERNIY